MLKIERLPKLQSQFQPTKKVKPIEQSLRFMKFPKLN